MSVLFGSLMGTSTRRFAVVRMSDDVAHPLHAPLLAARFANLHGDHFGARPRGLYVFQRGLTGDFLIPRAGWNRVKDQAPVSMLAELP